MNDQDSRKGKPVDPEIVGEDESDIPYPEGLSQVESGALGRAPALGFISNLFRSPRREARQSREWADAANAKRELNESIGNLVVSQERLRDLPTIIETDRVQRQTGLMQAQKELIRAENEKAEEERTARLKKLKDESAEEEARAELAEKRRRRQQAESPPPPVDEDTRRRAAIAAKFREKLGARYTEQEVRAHAERLVTEVRRRAGDRRLNESEEREIKNINDAMNALLDEL